MFALSTISPSIALLWYSYSLTDYSSCLTDLLVPRRAYSHTAAQGEFNGAFATARAAATCQTSPRDPPYPTRGDPDLTLGPNYPPLPGRLLYQRTDPRQVLSDLSILSIHM